MEYITYTVNKYLVPFTEAGTEKSGEPRYEEGTPKLLGEYPETVEVKRASMDEKKKLIIEVAQRLAGMNHHSFEEAKKAGLGYYNKLILSKL